MTEFKPQTTGIGSNRSATDPQPMHIKNRFDVQFFVQFALSLEERRITTLKNVFLVIFYAQVYVSLLCK